MITIILWVVFCVVTYLHPANWEVATAAAYTTILSMLTLCTDWQLVRLWRGKPKAADATVETSYPNGLREVVFGRCIDGPIRHYRASYIPGGDMFDLYTRYLNVDDALDTKVSYFSPVEARILHNALRKYLGIKEPAPRDALVLPLVPPSNVAVSDVEFLVRTSDGYWYIVAANTAQSLLHKGVTFTAIYKLPTA